MAPRKYAGPWAPGCGARHRELAVRRQVRASRCGAPEYIYMQDVGDAPPQAPGALQLGRDQRGSRVT